MPGLKNEKIRLPNSKPPHGGGIVHLVGAGLGDPAYLTCRGRELLQGAEVVVYDALIDLSLLALAPANCELISVGKRGGRASTTQRTINELLVNLAQSGKRVVRLKGGDPFIFGRANPEIAALATAQCAFTVVPGISAALAAPLLAGIPLTDRHWGRSLALVTGHEPQLLDWPALNALDTLVVLMAGKTLGAIVGNLLAQGKSPQTPCAVLKNSGTPQSQSWIAPLGKILEQTQGVSLSPAVIVIGEIIHLRHPIVMPLLPLTGQTILVTRSAEQSPHFRQLLQEQGAEVLEVPALEIGPPTHWQALDAAIAALQEFDWLILTSANAVNYFWQRLAYHHLDSRALAGVKIAVVGQKTAASLAQQGLQADLIPPDFIADALMAVFPPPLAGQKILFPRVETGGREVLVENLTQAGAQVTVVAAYQSGCPQHLPSWVLPLVRAQKLDVITFASSKTVECFYQLLHGAVANTEELNQLIAPVCLASIGPQTSQRCRQVWGRVDLEATVYTLEGLTQALVERSKTIGSGGRELL